MNLDKEINLQSLGYRFYYFYFLISAYLSPVVRGPGRQTSVELVEAGVRRAASADAGRALASKWVAAWRGFHFHCDARFGAHASQVSSPCLTFKAQVRPLVHEVPGFTVPHPPLSRAAALGSPGAAGPGMPSPHPLVSLPRSPEFRSGSPPPGSWSDTPDWVQDLPSTSLQPKLLTQGPQ